MSERDLSGRLFCPLRARPRRPLSNSASTASWSMRFSLRMMISGARSSMRRFSRLLRLITRRYRSLRSEVAKRPPSRGTRGRSSGGRTGITSRIIHSGLLPELRNASTILRRLVIFFRFCWDVSLVMRARSWLPSSEGVPVLLHRLPVLLLAEEVLDLEGRLAGVEDHVLLKVQDLLQVPQGH